ncbi:hypothetical protein ACV229_24450 [Burkholderia sp. MR1-5-21]
MSGATRSVRRGAGCTGMYWSGSMSTLQDLVERDHFVSKRLDPR